MMRVAHLFACISGAVVMNAAHTAELVILSAGAVKPALAELAPAWEKKTGHKLHITYATAGDLRRKLAAGEKAEIVVLPLENFAAVEKDGLTVAASRRDLGAVGIGIAVRAGAPVPDIGSEDGVKNALLGAKRVTYMDPNRGTSGKHMDEVVLPKLGIRDIVRAKATLGEGGMIAEKVARGEVDIAFQQMTEILPVKGIAIAGMLPPSLQKTTTYSAAVMTGAKSSAEAAALLEYLVTGEGRALFLAKGFTTP